MANTGNANTGNANTGNADKRKTGPGDIDPRSPRHGNGVGRTMAWYSSLEEVRRAETELERHGIDSMRVQIGEVDNVAERRHIDDRSIGWAARRGVIGLLVGAVAGALLGLLIGWLVMEDADDIAAFVLGGAVFGLAPGLLYSVFTAVPAASSTFDTFADDEHGSSCLAVEGPREVREKAAEVLSGVEPHPRRLVIS